MRLAMMTMGCLALVAVSCSTEVTEFPGSGGTGAGSGGSGGTGGSGTAGAGGGAVQGCSTNSDCVLFEDCCSCHAVPAGSNPPSCDMACDVPTCQAAGATTAICQYGSCTVGKVYGCDQSEAQCYQEPPVCDDGDLPEVASACWTGACVPAWLCDVVPDCTYCLDDEICVRSFNDGATGPWYSCRATPVGCTGAPDCACASLICDEGGFSTCTDIDGGIYCGF